MNTKQLSCEKKKSRKVTFVFIRYWRARTLHYWNYKIAKLCNTPLPPQFDMHMHANTQ